MYDLHKRVEILSDEKIKRWAVPNIYSNDPELLTDLRCMAREYIDQAARIKELEEVLENIGVLTAERHNKESNKHLVLVDIAVICGIALSQHKEGE